LGTGEDWRLAAARGENWWDAGAGLGFFPI
jgi:hypothetical protein